MFRKLTGGEDHTIQFLTLASFLVWFILSRLWVTYLPDTIIVIKGTHIHHYAYGVIMLSILSFVSLAYPLSRAWRLRLAIPLGIALASAYDEFAIWLYLTDLYHDRKSLDAILVIALILVNVTYFPGFGLRWCKRLKKLGTILTTFHHQA